MQLIFFALSLYWLTVFVLALLDRIRGRLMLVRHAVRPPPLLTSRYTIRWSRFSGLPGYLAQPLYALLVIAWPALILAELVWKVFRPSPR